MRKLIPLVAGLAALIVLSTPAMAREVEYVSQHPVPHKYGGGFCYIDVPHVHNYGPPDPRMFRESQGQNYFVGDPAPFDYDGPRYSYYGAHPVAEAELRLGQPVYCYIRGPHYHWYQPPPQAPFQFSGGAYWYVGNYPPSYYQERPRYAVINDAYAPMPYDRPVVDVQVAPVAVRAQISLGGPGWQASAIVGGPPAPVYYAPPPPPPSPIQIGVGINLGGPVVEQREMIERREYVDDRRPHWDHDRGRHEGWRDHDDDRGRHEGWRGDDRGRRQDWHDGQRQQERPFFQPSRQNPPSRFPPSRSVAREIPQRQPPSRGPVPHFGASQGPAPHGAGPAPSRGPAQQHQGPSRGPAPAQGRDDHRQNRPH